MFPKTRTIQITGINPRCKEPGHTKQSCRHYKHWLSKQARNDNGASSKVSDENCASKKITDEDKNKHPVETAKFIHEQYLSDRA